MSVTRVTCLYASLSGRDDATGLREYEAKYAVEVDNPNDGPKVVKNASGIPRYGDYWRTGTESDVEARLIDKQSSSDPENTLIHYVTCSYSTATNAAEGQAGAGAIVPEQKEIDLAPEFEWDFVERDVARYAAYEAELVQGNRVLLKLGRRDNSQQIPIANSARDFFDPPIQEDEARLVLRLSRAVGSYDPILAARYANALNSDTYLGFAPYVLLLKPLRARAVFDKGVQYWRLSVEIHINFDGWTHDLWDVGMREYWTPKEAKEIPGKKPGYNHIQNADNLPVTEPVLLDGKGHALVKPGAALDLREQTPAMWRYRTRKILPFGPLRLL